MHGGIMHLRKSEFTIKNVSIAIKEKIELKLNFLPMIDLLTFSI